MEPNTGGGMSNVVDSVVQFKRFLILGSYGSAYKSSFEMTHDNIENIKKMLEEEDIDMFMLDSIKEVVAEKRAPKQEPCIAALACILVYTSRASTKKMILFDMLGIVCPTFSNLTLFLGYLKTLHPDGKMSWGRCMRKGISMWMERQDSDKLLYQVTKYKNRNGYTPHDVLKLAHTKTSKSEVNDIFAYVCRKDKHEYKGDHSLCRAYHILRTTKDVFLVKDIINALPGKVAWEHIGNQQLLKDKIVWEALMQNKSLPYVAFLRNIGRMSSIGVSNTMLCEYLQDHVNGAHPINVLQAYLAHTDCHRKNSVGDTTWIIDGNRCDGLEAKFFDSIKGLEEIPNKKIYLALDVSASMASNMCVGMSNMTALDAEIALALSFMRKQPGCITKMFSKSLIDATFGVDHSLQDVYHSVKYVPFGGTDCSQPMLDALENGVFVDCFIVMTDNETNCNKEPPHIVLQRYRNKINPEAKLVVMAFSSSKFTIADPTDKGMLDVAGVDAGIWDVLRYFLCG